MFNQAIQHDGLTIVKFSAIWCGPCKAYAPIFDEIAEQLPEVSIGGEKVAVKYLSIDIDATPIIGKDCSITSVPTTIFYKNGKQVDSKTGSLTKEILASQIEELIKS